MVFVGSLAGFPSLRTLHPMRPSQFFHRFLGTGLGVYQALHPHVRRITLRTYKPLTRSMRIVFASDLHFGTLWGRRYGQKLVSRINAEDPDLVILAVTLWTAVFPLSCARAVWMPCAASALLWAYIPSWAIMISWQVRESRNGLIWNEWAFGSL